MLRGRKVRLRAPEREDLPLFVRWLNDTEVTRYLTLYWPLSMAEEEQWFENLLKRENDRVFVIETEEGKPIGNMGLHNIDWKNRKAVLGIFIGEKDYWGKGYGTDAIKTLLRFAFEELNLNRVELRVFEFNTRAIRCYEKCGFVTEGRLRQSLFRNGRYHDELVMAVLREEWKV
ncbi:MAG: N-acetyltransferase [Chloroflexi bacterium]|nr:MAG: N-acetyltransferase [Chloroflexota bacterium]HDN79985.1 N-acetyltransferase [Chloroflexota bacterium]